jgi:hypothetical protein
VGIVVSATQPTTLTAATVAAMANAIAAGAALRGGGASTVGSPASRSPKRAAKTRVGALDPRSVADHVVAHHVATHWDSRKPAQTLSMRSASSSPSIRSEISSGFAIIISGPIGPKSGRSSAAIASRALNIRERTVPIGQFITLAISS